MAKIYVLKSWKTCPGNPEGWWDNHKATFDEREAELWIEPPSRTINGEGPDPNNTYDDFEVKVPEGFFHCYKVFLAHDAVIEKLKKIAKEKPDWLLQLVFGMKTGKCYFLLTTDEVENKDQLRKLIDVDASYMVEFLF